MQSLALMDGWQRNYLKYITYENGIANNCILNQCFCIAQQSSKGTKPQEDRLTHYKHFEISIYVITSSSSSKGVRHDMCAIPQHKSASSGHWIKDVNGKLSTK